MSEGPSPSNCPSAEDLSAFAVGRMSAGRLELVATHVEQCSRCANAIATLSSDDDALAAELRMRFEPELTAPREQLRIVDLVARVSGESITENQGDGASGKLPDTVGDYRLIEKLATGGMGTAYKAMHTRLGKVVVIKFLHAERSSDPKAISRFTREMKAVGTIDHPHIVKAFDAGEWEGIQYLVMELIEGVNLSQLLDRHGVLPVASACEIVRQIAVGLAAIHKQGIVHRDIKPSNVMLTSTGHVKILDLGLALLTQVPNEPGDEPTRSGELMGTLEYASPEQLSNSRHIDARSDIFSLGATLYRLLTGRSPLVDEQYSVARRVLLPQGSQRTEVSPGLPKDLVPVLDRMMAVNVEKRFESCEDVANAIKPFCVREDAAKCLAGLMSDCQPNDLTDQPPEKASARDQETHEAPTDSHRERHGRVSVAAGEKAMTLQRAVGIDLGTTYSVAAWVDGSGRTAVIANSDGDILTPSAVVFEKYDIIVGKQASKLGVMKADRLAECVKRDMGNPFYSRPIDGDFLPPEIIQACVLKKLRQDISEKIGPDFGVVITVPAFFDDSRRRATAIAGEIAGLHVLDIVNEPIAGALAFREHVGVVDALPSAPDDWKVLVYDLGGGTFDVTLLQISQGGFTTLATDGDVRLGGRDWDMRLVDIVCRQFVSRFREDPRDNPVSLQRLLAEVERAKQTLSARQRATVRIDHAGNSLETRVKRDTFEEQTADLLERTSHTTRELLVTAGLQWKDVSRVLLVGGATRMPMVSKMLEELSGIAPDYVVSPDEAVARGAAIYAKHLLSAAAGSPSKFQITNVNSHNLGIQGIERATQEKVNAILIPRNTPLPVTTTRMFVTKKPDQRSIAVLVLEGESSLPSECTVIGRSVIRDLPKDLPQGHPVEVTYEYTTNGRLHVRASVPTVDRAIRIEIERGARLPDNRITEWKKALSGKGGLASLRKVLWRQEKRDKRPWRQVWGTDARKEVNAGNSVAQVNVPYDGVVVGPEQCDQQGRLREGPLQLDRTTENVSTPNAGEGEDVAAQVDSMTAAYRRPPTARRKRRKKSAALQLSGIVGGGILGIAIAQVILWWVLNQDPFELGPRIPKPVQQWIVPDCFWLAEG